MKRFNRHFLLALLVTGSVATAQVAINTNGVAPHASAMLDVSSTGAGVLIPRMTAAQRDAIPTPATGLMVYVTNDNLFYFYDGTEWTAITPYTGNSSDELQTLSRSGTDVSLSNGGGTVSLADNDNDSSNEIQALSKSGTMVSLSNGGGSVSIADNDNSSTNELDSKWATANNAIHHNDGDVGIGTSDPAALLHLSSASVGEATGFKITQGTYNSLIYHNIEGDLVLRKQGQTDQLVLDNGGFIGVGVGAPSQKLDVNGMVRIRGGSPGSGKVLTSSDANGNAVWSSPASPDMASTEGGGTTTISKGGNGSGWGDTNYSALLHNLSNGDRLLVFVSFKMKLSGGSGIDKANFRVRAENQGTGAKQYSMNTGEIDDLNRGNYQLYSFHRFIKIDQGAGNYRFYLEVDESLTDDTLEFDQQEISVVKF